MQMTVRDAINQLEQFAEQVGDDAGFKLYDRSWVSPREYVVDPDDDKWEFEILRGDHEVVIEFG
jgi:hypothetical protein